MSRSEHVLTVTASDELAEISVLDANLNRVAKGIGQIHERLASGLYKILVRVGSHVDEQLVALDQDRALSFPAPQIPTPIPLESSSRSNDDQRAAAIEAAANPRDTFGSGSSILIFVREWAAGRSGSQSNPATGLQLLDEKGNLLASMEDRADVRVHGDPCAGWRGDVTPDSYRLRLDLPDGTSTERALYAAPHTQTQIFLLLRDHQVLDRVLRLPDLAGGSIAISNSFSFDPDNARIRLSEIACYALTQTRHVLSDSLLRQLLSEKFDDPMLGLLGAHLVLRDHPQDTRLFQIVTDNLLRLLGPDHPDLRSLWLRRQERSGIKGLELRTPPMLRKSWDAAMEESVRNPEVIPLDSPSNDIMLNVLPYAPWLVWRTGSLAMFSSDSAESELPMSAKALVEFLHGRARLESRRTESTQGTATLEARQGPPMLSPEEKVEIARALGVSGNVIDEALQRLFH